MGHYDDLEAAKAYNEKLERKYATIQHPTIEDALGFCSGGLKTVEDPSYETKKFSECAKELPESEKNQWIEELNKAIELTAKKETKYKAEGARFCYLSSIASASYYAGGSEEQIGKYLDKLLDHDFRGECSTQHIFNMIITYCGIAIGDEKDLWDGVIAVRMHGLSSGKYSVNNHKLPMQKHLLLDAAARHLISYLYINNIDEESGESHLCHIVANILMFATKLTIEKGE